MLQALEQGAKLQREELHLKELGIATLTALFVNANRDPKSEPVKPANYFYFEAVNESDRVSIPAAICDAFFSLITDQLMPSWAVPLAPIERLQSGRAHDSVSKPRVWIGDGVLLLLPRVEDGWVKAELAIVEGNQAGKIELTDPDCEAVFYLELPPDEQRWELDAEFELVA